MVNLMRLTVKSREAPPRPHFRQQRLLHVHEKHGRSNPVTDNETWNGLPTHDVDDARLLAKKALNDIEQAPEDTQRCRRYGQHLATEQA